jgi:hypothetical protein
VEENEYDFGLTSEITNECEKCRRKSATVAVREALGKEGGPPIGYLHYVPGAIYSLSGRLFFWIILSQLVRAMCHPDIGSNRLSSSSLRNLL